MSAALLLCASLLLCSCSKGNKFTTSKDGVFVDNKTEIRYIDAPSCYEAISVDPDTYGKYGDVVFHRISGADPLLLLCEESGTVFFAEGTSLPALSEMNINDIGVYAEDSVTLLLGTVTDSAAIEKIIGDYLNGERIYYPERTPVTNLRIKFADRSLGICYAVVYVEYAEDYIIADEDGKEHNYGKKFFYNRFDGTFCVAGDYFDEYVQSYKSLTDT